jgi:GT2 family glycosyltransferase
MSESAHPRSRGGEPDNRDSYAAQLEASTELLDALPLEHLSRGLDCGALVRRLVAERAAMEAAQRDGARFAPVALLIDGRCEPADLVLTLATWELQSHPSVKACVMYAPDDCASGDTVHPPSGPASGSFAQWLARLGQAWVVLAKGGDIPHPGLAAAIAIHARCKPDPVAVTWNRMQYRLEDRFAKVASALRIAGLDPIALCSTDYIGRSIAYAADALRAAMPSGTPLDPFESDGWRLKTALLGSAGARWLALPEFLASYRDPLLRPLLPATASDRAVFETAIGTKLSPAGDGGGAMPARSARAVSVIIPFRDHGQATLRTLQAIAAQRSTAEIEVVLVDNQSRPATLRLIESGLAGMSARLRSRILHYPHPFNHSRQSNLGAGSARGEVLLFLNNDAELKSANALDLLARWALVEGVATVGARTVNADGQVVNAGIRARLRQLGLHESMVEERPHDPFSDITRCTTGNSFACAAVAAKTFHAVGGLDDLRFPIAYNDVDFCLRASRAGLRHVYVADAIVQHVPGGSRSKTDEVSQVFTLRSEHAWVLGAALHEMAEDPPGPRPITARAALRSEGERMGRRAPEDQVRSLLDRINHGKAQ